MSELIVDIIVKHLQKLNAESLRKTLCQVKPPFKDGKIEIKEVKEKSVEDIAELIVRRHTTKHALKTVSKCLIHMKENQMKLELDKDIANYEASEMLENQPTAKQSQVKENKKVVAGPSGEAKPSSKTSQKRAMKEEPSNNAPPKKKRAKQASEQSNKGEAEKQLQVKENGNVAGPSGEAGPSSKTLKKSANEEKPGNDVPSKKGSKQPDKGKLCATKELIEGLLPENCAHVNKPGEAEKQLQVKENGNVAGPSGEAGPSSKTPKKSASEEKPGNDVQPKKGSKQPDKDARKFLKKHWIQLIQMVKPVEPILDDLVHKTILTPEQRSWILKEETSQAQMRELCNGFVVNWSDGDKKTFVNILKKHHKPVINNLQKNNKK